LFVVAFALGACQSTRGAEPPPTPAIPATPQGFERVAAQVTAADGEVCDLCVWLADDGPRRARGLMGVADLGAADAMAFVYPAPTRESFWMKDTLLPLSIAFFGADGGFLDAFDMTPCTGIACTSYRAPDAMTVALEVLQGELPGLLIGPGSTLLLSEQACPEAAEHGVVETGLGT